MPEFFRDLRRIMHGGRDLAADQLAETRAQAVDGDFHGGFILSPITSKCTTCDHFKVHHFG